jgi:hypothetical protein
MALPARKLNFDEIKSSISYLTPGEKETLEIMLQEELYKDIINRRLDYKQEKSQGEANCIAEVIKEFEAN